MQISKLPYSELQVMQFIWSQNKKTPSKDVILEMEEKNSWKQTTTLTLISRLIKRDFLSVEKIGRDRKSTRLNSSHNNQSRMPSSA